MGFKRAGFASGGLVVTAAAGMSLVAYRYTPVYAPGTVVGVVPIGGLTPDEARKRLRLWWEDVRVQEVTLAGPVSAGFPHTSRWSRLGIRIDDAASIEPVPLEGFWDSVGRVVQQSENPLRFPVQFQIDRVPLETLAGQIKNRSAERRPAKAQWVNGAVERTFEIAPQTLDVDATLESLIAALREGASTIEVPIVVAEKRVPDEALQKITDVMGAFSTKFPASNRPRSANIKLATGIIDGLVLMPGERFSFNEVVGPRTSQRGFRMAGVFVNGRLDEGIGGGICQVSTTLYNSALLSDLKIIERRNHSLAVPYVQVGRDAAVSYGAIDLVLENSHPFPVALDGTYTPGEVTFRVLGIKDPSVTITIERVGLRSWSRGVKEIHDGSLPPGRVRVEDKGGLAHRVTTFRVVRRDGKVIRRENLGVSSYPGSPRLVARNRKATPASAAPEGGSDPAINAPIPATVYDAMMPSDGLPNANQDELIP